MNIKILDSWLKDYVKTKATPQEIAEKLSLTSASIERIEPFNDDYNFDIEITTNRIDLASAMGMAREAAAVLPQFGIAATFASPKLAEPQLKADITQQETITIESDPNLIYRICAVIMEITIGESPQWLKDRLEATGIRSLNTIVDITNYVMRDIGHPTHVFDYDRLTTKKLIIRESKRGEKVVTLDKKEHVLQGGDIVADNGRGEIVDLIGIMGTENSVITSKTKRILFFLDNNDPHRIRKTSMSLGIRTEAAQLNEKNIDSQLTYTALLRGVQLYKELANAKLLSDAIDMYPKKTQAKKITISQALIDQAIGIHIPLTKAATILEKLGFTIQSAGDELSVHVPSWRSHDVTIAQDLIEEIARVYGYHNLPTLLPPIQYAKPYHQTKNVFFWEKRIKDALKYWGFTEVYTYSMVSEDMFEGPLDEAVTIHNPLHEELVYMRKTLTPSLLQIMQENKKRDVINIFEVANVYHKQKQNLPLEIHMLSGLIKNPSADFFLLKGILEQLTKDCGIASLLWKNSEIAGTGADIFIGKDFLGEIEVLDKDLLTFELNLDLLIQHATLKKIFTPLAKYPPILEDITMILEPKIQTGDIIKEIKNNHSLIKEVTLLDTYKNTRTFHIVYQHPDRNLTNEEIGVIREKIITCMTQNFSAIIK